MTAHNPALPHTRRALAVEALRAGPALHLDVPAPLARQAVADADQLARQHGEAGARWLLTPRQDDGDSSP